MAEFDFRTPELSDRAWVEPLLAQSGFRGCLYTFGNNYVWKDVYNVKICRWNDFYVLQNSDHSDTPRFLYPAGEGNIELFIKALRGYCAELKIPLKMSANKECTEKLLAIYTEITVHADRDGFDYVYNTSDLAELRGRKYHSKRNHLNRFYENDWSFEEINADNIQFCREVLEQWLNADNDDEEKLTEAEVVRKSLADYSALGYRGGVLFADGKPEAFTFGERSSNDTFVVHVEKALLDFQGAYTAVNCEFAKTLVNEYSYINREEDAGSEGLRRAKLSYHPAFLEEKYFIDFGGQI
mgnify:FL=1